MKLQTGGLLLATLLLAGCWQKSVHPFYTPKDLITEPKLGGTWTEQKKNPDEKKMQWTFNDATPLRFDLVIRDGEEKHPYDAHVFRLDGARYLDLQTAGPREVSKMPVHHLFKIEEVGETLKLTPLDINWVQKWLRKNPNALAHVAIVDPEHRDDREQDELVLTADTKALQSFLRTHSKDEDFWGETVTFKR
jgi:hypothetical protein